MTDRYWFRPKSYGFGFIPITWEGWVCVFIVVVLIFTAASIDGIFSDDVTREGLLRFILDLVFIAAFTALVFERRMKEPLRWRWGKWLK